MAHGKLLISLALLALATAVTSHRGRNGGRCTQSSCDGVTCAVGQMCEVQSGRARCVRATSCDDVTCPEGLECSVRSGRTGGVECTVSCDDVTCPLIHECEERGRGLSSTARCVRPSACPSSCPFTNATCETNGRGSRGTAQCVGSSDSCDDITCPAGSECVVRGRRGRGRRQGTGTPGTSGSRSSSRRVTACSPVCTNSTCPDGLVCEESGSSDDRTVSCRAPRNCDEASCPSGSMCVASNCPTPRGGTPRTGSRAAVAFSCVPETTTPSRPAWSHLAHTTVTPHPWSRPHYIVGEQHCLVHSQNYFQMELHCTKSVSSCDHDRHHP